MTDFLSPSLRKIPSAASFSGASRGERRWDYYFSTYSTSQETIVDWVLAGGFCKALRRKGGGADAEPESSIQSASRLRVSTNAMAGEFLVKWPAIRREQAEYS